MTVVLNSQLVKQNKSDDEVRQLAADFAHDFNNILNVVGGYLQLIQESPDEPERVACYLQRAQKAIEGASSITLQLLAFSKQSGPSMPPVSSPPAQGSEQQSPTEPSQSKKCAAR